MTAPDRTILPGHRTRLAAGGGSFDARMVADSK